MRPRPTFTDKRLFVCVRAANVAYIQQLVFLQKAAPNFPLFSSKQKENLNPS